MGPGALSVCVMMVCLLGAARRAAGDKESCPCPDIPWLSDTEVPPRECRQLHDRFRYTCIEGKLRKAGTSSLTICSESEGKVSWSNASLICIDDPNRPPGTVTTAHTPSPHDIITTGISSTISASTRLQTPRETTSASVVTQTNSAEPTSVSLQDASNHSQVTEDVTAVWTTATAAASATSTANSTALHDTSSARISGDADNVSLSLAGEGTAVGISCVSLVIICASVGFILYCYLRRQRRNISQEEPEELVPMNSLVVNNAAVGGGQRDRVQNGLS